MHDLTRAHPTSRVDRAHVHPPFRSSFPAALGLTLLLGACAAPPEEPLVLQDVIAAATLRAVTPEDVRVAFDLAEVERYAYDVPSAEEFADPSGLGYWAACAYAFDPHVREARGQLEILLEERGAAGRPGPTELQDQFADPFESTRMHEVKLTFDLLGWLGRGPAEAERALADAEVRRARAELGSRLWEARFEVERAALRLAAARTQMAALTWLEEEALADLTRLEILARRGRLSELAYEAARSRLHAVEHRRSAAVEDEAAARAELGRRSGLHPDHPALAAPGEELLQSFAAAELDQRLPSHELLIGLHPKLAALRFEYAVAEARVRRAGADRQPGVRLGPRAVLRNDDWLPGGLVRFEFPDGRAVDARVAAAERARTLARERLEDALLDHLHAARVREVALRQARTRLVAHALPLDSSTDHLWMATRTRFRVGEATSAEWGEALGGRIGPLTLVTDEALAVALATLDLQELAGPAGLVHVELEPDPNPETLEVHP